MILNFSESTKNFELCTNLFMLIGLNKFDLSLFTLLCDSIFNL